MFAMRRSADRGGLEFSILLGWSQPERDMGGLHRFFNHRYQFLSQPLQVYLIAQGSAEGSKGTGGIVLPTVEAPIDDLLNAMAQRLEQGGDHKSRGDNGDVRCLTDESAQHKLQRDDESNIEQGQRGCQCAVDQGAVDDDIDIPKS